jgi:hypothetical protein
LSGWPVACVPRGSLEDAMDAPDLFAICQHAPQRLPELAPAILRAVADGTLTEWVITYGTYFERVAWAALLIEAAADDETFLTHAEMVELFGAKWAARFRLGMHRLQKKILKHFATKARKTRYAAGAGRAGRRSGSAPGGPRVPRRPGGE